MTKQAKSCLLSFYMTYSHGDTWQAGEDFSGGLLQSSLFQGALVISTVPKKRPQVLSVNHSQAFSVISRFILSKILWSSVSILGQKRNSEKVRKVSKVAQVLRGAKNAHQPSDWETLPSLTATSPCASQLS